jgi:UDP-galactopyranose mutase
MYDYLIVGAGLFISVFAHEMTKKGKKWQTAKIYRTFI